MKKLISYFIRLTPFRIAVALTVVVLAADIIQPVFLQTVDLKALDVKFKTRGIRPPSDRVAIIAIDEKSIQEMGRWPWPRSTHGELLKKLKEEGAAAVGFDIVFSEPDKNSELMKVRQLLERYKELGLDHPPTFGSIPIEYANAATAAIRPLIAATDKFHRELQLSEAQANSDQYLAEAINAFRDRTVLGYFFFGGEISQNELQTVKKSGFNEALIEPSKVGLVSTVGSEPDFSTERVKAAVPNIELLSKATDNYGHFYMIPDPEDGTIRWNHLVLNFKDGYYPSLGLKLASVALNQPILLKIDSGTVGEVRVGDIRIPTDEKGRLLINYAGPLSVGRTTDVTFKVFSFSDVMKGLIPASEIKDRIFVVGPTAVGIYDLRNTPFDAMFPGVGVHANVISNIITQDFLQKPKWMTVFDVLIIVAMGMFLGISLGRLRAVSGALVAMALAGAYLAFTQFAFESWGIWLSTVYPELEVISIFAAIVTYKYLTEERQAKQIRGAFANYVTPSVVDQVLEDPSKLKLGGEMRDLSVMFSDIRGFTTISEKLTPEQLVDLLNAYLSKMTDLVFKSDGTLDKYIGDALMAIWGAPIEQPDHAKRACHTAIEMMETLAELKPKWQSEGLKHIEPGGVPDVDIGIGINSGRMSVGNMGSDQRFDYTVMGDNVNLASRLEGTNKMYGTNIIISEYTVERAAESIVVRELDFVKVKGKHEPVRIFELVGKKGAVDSATLEKIDLFAEGLKAYRAQQWDAAEAALNKLHARWPGDKVAPIFLHRVEEFREADLGPDWDGVYEMKTK